MSTTGQVSSYSTITYTMNSYQAATTTIPVATMSTQSTQNSSGVTYNNVNVRTVSSSYNVQGITQPPVVNVVWNSSAEDGIVIVKGTSNNPTTVAFTSGANGTPAVVTSNTQRNDVSSTSTTYKVTTPPVTTFEQTVKTPEETTITRSSTTPGVIPSDTYGVNSIKTPAVTASNNTSIISSSNGVAGGTPPVTLGSNVTGITTPGVTYYVSGGVTPVVMIRFTNSANSVSTPAVAVTNEDNEKPRLLENVDIHTILDLVGFIPGFGDVADAINAVVYLVEGDYTNAAISAAGIVLDGATALRTAGKAADAVETTYIVAKQATKDAIQDKTTKAITEEIIESSSTSAAKIGSTNRTVQSYTREEIINSLNGVTEQSTEIANAIQNKDIGMNVLGDELFESYLGCTPETVAMQVGDQIYVRSSSTSLISDVVHEGTHAMDYLKGIDENDISSWAGETRAYSAERIFQVEASISVQFPNEEDMMIHIWKNYNR